MGSLSLGSIADSVGGGDSSFTDGSSTDSITDQIAEAIGDAVGNALKTVLGNMS